MLVNLNFQCKLCKWTFIVLIRMKFQLKKHNLIVKSQTVQTLNFSFLCFNFLQEFKLLESRKQRERTKSQHLFQLSRSRRISFRFSSSKNFLLKICFSISQKERWTGKFLVKNRCSSKWKSLPKITWRGQLSCWSDGIR